MELSRTSKILCEGRSISLNWCVVHGDSSGHRQRASRSQVHRPGPKRQLSHWNVRWINHRDEAIRREALKVKTPFQPFSHIGRLKHGEGRQPAGRICISDDNTIRSTVPVREPGYPCEQQPVIGTKTRRPARPTKRYKNWDAFSE